MTKIQLYVMLKLLSARLDIADIYQHLHFGVLSLSLSLSLSLYFLFILRRDVGLCSSSVSCALSTGPTSTLFKKKNFKTRFHSTIHTFKNYFTTVFSVFSKISGIQIDP